MRALWRSSLLGIPASALLALIFGSSVPLSRRLAFVAFVSLADVVHDVRRRCATCAGGAGARSMTRSVSGLICTMLTAAAWGSPALFALPGSGNVELRAVYLLFVCGTSATYVVGTAARRLYFYASQLPMLVPVAIVFTTSGDHVTRLLGLAVPIYFVVMASLHHEVHGVVVSELQLREHNDETNARLADANAQLVQRALRDELTGLAESGRVRRRACRTPSPTRGSRARSSACCTSTSTGSRSSTTRSATRPATCSSSRSRDACTRCCAAPTSSPASAATSSRCCSTSSTATPKRS